MLCDERSGFAAFPAAAAAAAVLLCEEMYMGGNVSVSFAPICNENTHHSTIDGFI
jgi:hypothetical protein